jgi:hypothetical protein
MMMEQMMTEMKIWELERELSIDKINCYYNELKSRLINGEIPDLQR